MRLPASTVETCELLIEAGKVSSEKRNEMVLFTDVLGVESLLDVRNAHSSCLSIM
jgi:hypothetical protein